MPTPPDRPPIPDEVAEGRFTAARSSFSRFVRSGGRDRASLGRAVSHYISTTSGGAKRAAQRMGSSRASGARLVGFLSDVSSRGVGAALRALNLEGLAGRPIDEVFLGLADYICPDGGTIDEGIAREAFIEMIADVAESGITDLDRITAEQMQTVFELFATHAIEARLCNDIGMKTITLPADARDAMLVQEQLQDFIRRGVSDALAAVRDSFQALTPDRVLGFVDVVYEQAFGILQSLGDMEAERV
ncbi:MAG: Qat anti-phage system associated protein QatB [Desulfobaccales bacterium]